MHVALGMIVLFLWMALMVTLLIAVVALVSTGRLPWTTAPGSQRRLGRRIRALTFRRGRSKVAERRPVKNSNPGPADRP